MGPVCHILITGQEGAASSYLTGCRSGGMPGLEWSRVDLENNRIRFEASHTKTKKARTVPLNPSASQALLAQREEQSRHGLKTPFVFAHIDSLWRGQRIGDLKKSFASACSRAGIKGVTPHTLRHTFASWLVMAGRPLLEVRDLLGHSTIKMTERYAHLAPENLGDAVSSIEGRPHFGSTADHNEKTQGDDGLQVIDMMDKKWWARKGSNWLVSY